MLCPSGPATVAVDARNIDRVVSNKPQLDLLIPIQLQTVITLPGGGQSDFRFSFACFINIYFYYTDKGYLLYITSNEINLLTHIKHIIFFSPIT